MLNVVEPLVKDIQEDQDIPQSQAAQLLSKHQDLISQLEVLMSMELFHGEQHIQPSSIPVLHQRDANSMIADTHGAEPSSPSPNHAAHC